MSRTRKPEPRLEFPEPTADLLAAEPWRADARWIEARDRSVRDALPGETANERLVAGIRAQYDMYLVAAEYELRTRPAQTAPAGPRDDLRWLQARADYIDDEREGEDHDAVYVRRVKASVVMHDIEKEYKARNRTT